MYLAVLATMITGASLDTGASQASADLGAWESIRHIGLRYYALSWASDDTDVSRASAAADDTDVSRASASSGECF
jgi:hypothetical protein